MLIWIVWTGVVFSLLVLAALIHLNFMLIRTLRNEKRLEDFAAPALPDLPPLVSIVVPAKDEAATVEGTVRSILESEYDRMELILVNDRSRDDTAVTMESLARDDPRVSVVTVHELPEGWTGKTHALYRGARQASGDLLLFTDADTVLHRETIAKAVRFFSGNDADMLSLLPQFTERRFSENAVYPHLALGFSSMYPLTQVNDPRDKAALASGCFIMIRRQAYEGVGTWERFREEITEDVALAKAVKASGFRLSVMRGGDLVRTKPFDGLADVCLFWKRTFYGGLERSIPKILRLTANYVVLTILFGFLGLSTVLMISGDTDGASIALFVLSTLGTAGVVVPYGYIVRQEQGGWWYGLTAPLGMAISAWVAWSALLAVVSGRGIHWRGSVYK
ncbi:MAG: glycosyltransferase family 2 protein [Desulfomonilaceae bacterium]|nr:glycosyltransferase family 2 protein [Desulfomonilaceae bacterium]